ncbi:hypothetical protein AMELA_G00048410, partial [Ameiurus melas]
SYLLGWSESCTLGSIALVSAHIPRGKAAIFHSSKARGSNIDRHACDLFLLYIDRGTTFWRHR